MCPLSNLRDGLARLLPGKLCPEDIAKVRQELALAWNSLDGADATKMAARKLGRVEEIEWRPPLLLFAIERHGATARGSSLAEIQHWTVDLDAATATASTLCHRQIRPRDSRLDVAAIAKQICLAVLAGCDAPLELDRALRWVTADEVRVRVSSLVDGNNEKTRSGRSRRLRQELERQMLEIGWRYKSGRVAQVFVRNDDNAPAQL